MSNRDFAKMMGEIDPDLEDNGQSRFRPARRSGKVAAGLEVMIREVA
jgi:hypothetical protein